MSSHPAPGRTVLRIRPPQILPVAVVADALHSAPPKTLPSQSAIQLGYVLSTEHVPINHVTNTSRYIVYSQSMQRYWMETVFARQEWSGRMP